MVNWKASDATVNTTVCSSAGTNVGSARILR